MLWFKAKECEAEKRIEKGQKHLDDLKEKRATLMDRLDEAIREMAVGND